MKSMWHVCFFIIFSLIVLSCTENNSVSDEDVAEETQHAICKILTQEIQTSANATVKRQLKGVCTTKQLQRQFRQLEHKLLLELEQIRTLLENDREGTLRHHVKPSTEDYNFLNYFDNEDDDQIVSVTKIITREASSQRAEIHQLNDTIFTLKGEKVYNYYWKISDIRGILRKNGIHMRSPDFTVLGHQMCLQIYPKHLNSNYVGIQLRPSGNFLKKHKFAILDQLDSSKDIISQIFGGISSYESIYRVPYEKLEERKYLHNNEMVIKITIFLNS